MTIQPYKAQLQLIHADIVTTSHAEHSDRTLAATATAATTADHGQKASHRSMSNFAIIDLGELSQLYMHAAGAATGRANRLAAVEGAGEVQIGAARRAGNLPLRNAISVGVRIWAVGVCLGDLACSAPIDW